MTWIRAISCALLINLLASIGANAAKKAEKPVKQAEPLAQDTPLDNLKDAPKAPSLACAGPFAKDTTHAKLVAEFGAKNVVFKDVQLISDVTTQASVIFDDDPTKRVVVYWKDNKTRTGPTSISIEAPSIWTGPGDIRNGLSLRELVKLNGGEFQMTGFGGIGGGEISGLKGPLADVPGDCTLKIRLEPGIANPLPPRFASVTGDQLIASKNLVLRRVRPQVAQWSVNYR
jgi:hypothetical protein